MKNSKTLAFMDYPNHRVTRTGHCWSKESGQWRKLSNVSTGKYVAVGLCRNGKQRAFLVHRLVLLAFVGPCPEGMECRHLDGNPKNNNLCNLCWGTKKENGEDKVKHGNSMLGTTNPNVRLNAEKVIEIRRLWDTGWYQLRDLGTMFEVDHTTIAQVVKRVTWKQV